MKIPRDCKENDFHMIGYVAGKNWHKFLWSGDGKKRATLKFLFCPYCGKQVRKVNN